jgi:hypothetical protein
MSDSAFQTMYLREFIAGFEKRQALSRHTVVTKTEINGNEAVFLVADSGGATAVTRGINGDIPTRPDNLNQYTATLQEWHDVPERTRFNIYASQGDGRRIMQQTSMAVVNRKIDEDIRSALSSATQTHTMTQTGAANFLADILEMQATLGENNALDEEPFALITPAFRSNLMTLNQFSSRDYVNNPAFENVSISKAFNWNGVNWIVDSEMSGVGTNAAVCYLYNRNSIGHACDMERISTQVGYDSKNDKSWARTSTFMGSKLLQNSGIIKITHDDTTFIGA